MEHRGDIDGGALLGAAVVMIVLYWPTIVAFYRGMRLKGCVCLVNTLFALPSVSLLLLPALWVAQVIYPNLTDFRPMAGIVAVTALLGWVMIAWIGCLIWACAGETRGQVEARDAFYRVALRQIAQMDAQAAQAAASANS